MRGGGWVRGRGLGEGRWGGNGWWGLDCREAGCGGWQVYTTLNVGINISTPSYSLWYITVHYRMTMSMA